jgi:hypothetical protein
MVGSSKIGHNNCQNSKHNSHYTQKMALTMTFPQDAHCPIASNKRGNINTTTSPDLPDAPLVALRCGGLIPPPLLHNNVVLSMTDWKNTNDKAPTAKVM